jgi:hypothetical protein
MAVWIISLLLVTMCLQGAHEGQTSVCQFVPEKKAALMQSSQRAGTGAELRSSAATGIRWLSRGDVQ